MVELCYPNKAEMSATVDMHVEKATLMDRCAFTWRSHPVKSRCWVRLWNHEDDCNPSVDAMINTLIKEGLRLRVKAQGLRFVHALSRSALEKLSAQHPRNVRSTALSPRRLNPRCHLECCRERGRLLLGLLCHHCAMEPKILGHGNGCST